MSRTAVRLRLAAAIMALAAASSGCASSGYASGPIEPARLARVRDMAREAVERGYAPGVVTLVYAGDRVVLADARGRADLARERPVAMDSLFRIYSMTKPVTAVAAMILVENGKLSLDAPVSRYLPEFAGATVYRDGGVSDFRADPLRRPVTVRDLMRHTAGLTYKLPADDTVHRLYALRGIDTGSGADGPPLDGSAPVASLDELSRRIASIPLMNQPGERFTYGNASDVLGRVVEVVSGQRLRDFIAVRILGPLGMRDTYFEVPEAAADRLTAAYSAKTVTLPGDGVLTAAPLDALDRGTLTLVDDPPVSVYRRSRSIDYGGAGLVSTAPDYLRFLRMLMNGGELDGVRILRKSSVAEMTRNQLDAAAAATPALASQGFGYGLGFGIILDPSRAPAAVPSGGYFWGGAASTYFWVDPSRRIAGVVMTQVFGGDFRSFYLGMLDALYAPAPVLN